jgi:hypothetical protein
MTLLPVNAFHEEKDHSFSLRATPPEPTVKQDREVLLANASVAALVLSSCTFRRLRIPGRTTYRSANEVYGLPVSVMSLVPVRSWQWFGDLVKPEAMRPECVEIGR